MLQCRNALDGQNSSPDEHVVELLLPAAHDQSPSLSVEETTMYIAPIDSVTISCLKENLKTALDKPIYVYFFLLNWYILISKFN